MATRPMASRVGRHDVSRPMAQTVTPLSGLAYYLTPVKNRMLRRLAVRRIRARATSR